MEEPIPQDMRQSLTTYSHPCAYLPGRVATMEFSSSARMATARYEQLLNGGFRRCGETFYRPICHDCRACRQLRVLAQEFRPERSMRRNVRRNEELDVCWDVPRFTDEKFDLYQRYLTIRHGSLEPAGFVDFLYDSPTETREMEFRRQGNLVAVAIADVVPSGLSAVYCYYEPEQQHCGLGTYAILWQIDYCRRHGWPHLYLGFHVSECRKMNYKSRFLPHEILDSDGHWYRLVNR